MNQHLSPPATPAGATLCRGRRDFRAIDRTGGYAVEFAICCSVFFMSIFACLELSRYVYVRQAINQTAYEACREGIVRGGDVNNVISRANAMLSAYGVSNTQITVDPTTIDDSTMWVTVSLVCDFTQNSWMVPDYVKATTISTSITLDHENAAFVVPENSTDDSNLTDNDEPQDV